MMKLPLKTRILQYAIEQDAEITVNDVMAALASEYLGECIFSRKQVEEYIDSYLGVGFLTGSRMEFDESGNLVVYSKVTDYGKSRLKYMH